MPALKLTGDQGEEQHQDDSQAKESVILSSQSAANVKKETLCQPALEILDTSSQESSLESDTDEDDDYMDI